MNTTIEKAAKLQSMKATEADLEKINQMTLEPLSAEEVYTFKMIMATDADNDRNHMPFNKKALEDMRDLYIGKPLLKDHNRHLDSQIGRIYDTEIMTVGNESVLVGKAFILNNDANKSLIADLKAGIKKEVSTTTMPEKLICSICGTNAMKEYCRHYPGSTYKDQTCTFMIDGCKDVAEVSLVCVPAQPGAGVIKALKDEHEESLKKRKDAQIRVKMMEMTSFLMHERSEKDHE